MRYILIALLVLSLLPIACHRHYDACPRCGERHYEQLLVRREHPVIVRGPVIRHGNHLHETGIQCEVEARCVKCGHIYSFKAIRGTAWDPNAAFLDPALYGGIE